MQRPLNCRLLYALLITPGLIVVMSQLLALGNEFDCLEEVPIMQHLAVGFPAGAVADNSSPMLCTGWPHDFTMEIATCLFLRLGRWLCFQKDTMIGIAVVQGVQGDQPVVCSHISPLLDGQQCASKSYLSSTSSRARRSSSTCLNLRFTMFLPGMPRISPRGEIIMTLNDARGFETYFFREYMS